MRFDTTGDAPDEFVIGPAIGAVISQYNLKDDRGLNEWSVTFTFTALFPAS